MNRDRHRLDGLDDESEEDKRYPDSNSSNNMCSSTSPNG